MSGARRDEILGSVEHLVAVHDRWAADAQAALPTRALEEAVEAVVETCATGDVPHDCRDVVAAAARLGVAWGAYRDGDRAQGGHPRQEVWSRMADVFHCLRGVAAHRPRTIEPVALLCEQLKDFAGRDLQIARMYGHRIELRDGKSKWVGPFFDDREVPRGDLIRQEAEKPGSVIPPGWIHPSEEARVREANAADAARIARTTERAAEPAEDPASVEEHLRDGQYPDVIATVKRTTEAAVRAEAAEKGIVPNERPNLRAVRSDHEQPIPAEVNSSVPSPGPAGAGSNSVDDRPGGDKARTKGLKGTRKPPTEAAGMSAEDLASAVSLLAESDPSLGAPDIVRRIREDYGAVVTVQAVSEALAVAEV